MPAQLYEVKVNRRTLPGGKYFLATTKMSSEGDCNGNKS